MYQLSLAYEQKYNTYTVGHKKTKILFVHDFGRCWTIFKILSPLDLSNICNKTLVVFPPYINYVATLPCETKNATFIILPLQQLQKLTSTFIHFFS